MLRVFVALGKRLPKDKKMIEDTAEVSKLLAKYNCTLVQGGARTGLMGVVVEEFQKYSDEVVMIVPEVHKADLEGTKNKEHYIVEGEADRLKITINTCDLIVVLPGGTGTLAELAYYNETCKSGEHNSKIVMVNTNGYYNKLFKFVKHQVKKGFMNKDDFKFEVISDVNHLESIIKDLLTHKQEKTAQEVVNNKDELIEDMSKVAKVKSVKKTTKPTTKSSNKKANSSKKTESKVSKKSEKVSEVPTTKKKTVKVAENKKATDEKKFVPTKKSETGVKSVKKPAEAKKPVTKKSVDAKKTETPKTIAVKKPTSKKPIEKKTSTVKKVDTVTKKTTKEGTKKTTKTTNKK